MSNQPQNRIIDPMVVDDLRPKQITKGVDWLVIGVVLYAEVMLYDVRPVATSRQT
jgi:hypothetical protein